MVLFEVSLYFEETVRQWVASVDFILVIVVHFIHIIAPLFIFILREFKAFVVFNTISVYACECAIGLSIYVSACVSGCDEWLSVRRRLLFKSLTRDWAGCPPHRVVLRFFLCCLKAIPLLLRLNLEVFARRILIIRLNCVVSLLKQVTW